MFNKHVIRPIFLENEHQEQPKQLTLCLFSGWECPNGGLFRFICLCFWGWVPGCVSKNNNVCCFSRKQLFSHILFKSSFLQLQHVRSTESRNNNRSQLFRSTASKRNTCLNTCFPAFFSTYNRTQFTICLLSGSYWLKATAETTYDLFEHMCSGPKEPPKQLTICLKTCSGTYLFKANTRNNRHNLRCACFRPLICQRNIRKLLSKQHPNKLVLCQSNIRTT